jgi:capsular polysaccharide biosynthesis protein
METEEISLVELFDILKKHFKLIVITTLATTIIAVIYTFFLVTPTYQSSTEMIVTQSTDSTSQNISQSDINTSISLINTYEDIIRNDVILDPVIEDLELDMTTAELRENISVQINADSQVFSIQAQSENPYEASEIANTTANMFQEEIYEIMDVDNVTVISEAVPNVNPASPNNILNIIIGVLLGGMLGIGLVFLRELTDNTVKTEEFIEEATGWTSLGHINQFSKQDLVVKTPLPRAQRQAEAGQDQKQAQDQDEEMSRTRRRV